MTIRFSDLEKGQIVTLLYLTDEQVQGVYTGYVAALPDGMVRLQRAGQDDLVIHHTRLTEIIDHNEEGRPTAQMNSGFMPLFSGRFNTPIHPGRLMINGRLNNYPYAENVHEMVADVSDPDSIHLRYRYTDKNLYGASRTYTMEITLHGYREFYPAELTPSMLMTSDQYYAFVHHEELYPDSGPVPSWLPGLESLAFQFNEYMFCIDLGIELAKLRGYPEPEATPVPVNVDPLSGLITLTMADNKLWQFQADGMTLEELAEQIHRASQSAMEDEPEDDCPSCKGPETCPSQFCSKISMP